MIEQQARSRPESADGSDKGEVPAVRKTVAIVRYLNGRAPAGATLRETAGDLEITNSHCHNILRTLIRHNWVGYDALSRRYRLQPGLCADALSAFSQFEPIVQLRPLVAQLAAAIGITCILSQVEPDGTFLVIDKADGTNGFGVTVPIGHRFTRRCAGAAQGGPRLAAGGGDPGMARRLAAGRPHRPQHHRSRDAAGRSRGDAGARLRREPRGVRRRRDERGPADLRSRGPVR